MSYIGKTGKNSLGYKWIQLLYVRVLIYYEMRLILLIQLI